MSQPVAWKKVDEQVSEVEQVMHLLQGAYERQGREGLLMEARALLHEAQKLVALLDPSAQWVPEDGLSIERNATTAHPYQIGSLVELVGGRWAVAVGGEETEYLSLNDLRDSGWRPRVEA